MQKIDIELMRKRNADARMSIEKATECTLANNANKAELASFIDKAQEVVGLQQLEIGQLDLEATEMSDEQLNAFRVLLAEYTILKFRLDQLRIKLRE